MIFWKRSSFIDSVRHSAGCNYFFYLKALQILYFSRGSAIEGNPHFFHTVHSFWPSAGNTQEIKWLQRTQQKPGHEVTGAEWEVSRSAGFDHLCLTLFLQGGEKNEAGERTH